jgi:hypothetical protein
MWLTAHFHLPVHIINPVNATIALNYKGLPLEKFIDGNYTSMPKTAA